MFISIINVIGISFVLYKNDPLLLLKAASMRIVFRRVSIIKTAGHGMYSSKSFYKAIWALTVLSVCWIASFTPFMSISYAHDSLSAPLKSLIDREVMGSLAAQQALQMQGQLVVLQQVGYGNQFNSFQQGFGNRIITLQHGNELSANLIQVGYDNVIQLAQFGDERMITVEQYGNQAAISIEQY